MKQIIENKYFKSFRFSSSDESLFFFKNQIVKRSLALEETFGKNYYCYVCYNSLTREKEFVLSFNSNESEHSLNLLLWNNQVVLDTGNYIFLIDEALKIKVIFDITTPLVGLYLVNNENLLLLEEAYMRVINYKGEVVKSELFDLIEDFSIKEDLLYIQTEKGNKIIKLI